MAEVLFESAQAIITHWQRPRVLRPHRATSRAKARQFARIVDKPDGARAYLDLRDPVTSDVSIGLLSRARLDRVRRREEHRIHRAFFIPSRARIPIWQDEPADLAADLLELSSVGLLRLIRQASIVPCRALERLADGSLLLVSDEAGVRFYDRRPSDEWDGLPWNDGIDWSRVSTGVLLGR